MQSLALLQESKDQSEAQGSIQCWQEANTECGVWPGCLLRLRLLVGILRGWIQCVSAWGTYAHPDLCA